MEISKEDLDLEIISEAWKIFHTGSFQEALDLSTPLSETYELAISICILANVKLGNLADSDSWTIQAGNQGVRDFWIDVQGDNQTFAVLAARLDAISAHNINTPLSSFEYLALTRYLFEGFHADLSLWHSVNFIRRYWLESEADELKMARRFYLILSATEWNDDEKIQFLANLGFLLNCSLSSNETEIIINDLYATVITPDVGLKLKYDEIYGLSSDDNFYHEVTD